jgi:hypothetical protein
VKEKGSTLSGVTVSLAAALAVVLAALAFVDMSKGVPPPVRARDEPPGRLAMRQVVRELNARVCLSPGGAAIVSGQDYSVTFYSFEGDSARGFVPERHTITWNPGTRALIDYGFVGLGPAPGTTFPGSPTRTVTLAPAIAPAGGAPMFAYYAWSAGGRAGPSTRLPTPLSSIDAQRVVRIAVRFRARALGRSKRTLDLRREVLSPAPDAGADGSSGMPNC